MTEIENMKKLYICVDLGVRCNLANSVEVKHNNFKLMNMIFYKYRTDSKYTEQILMSRKIYLSTAEGLNDPFECSLQEIGFEWIREQIKESQQAGVAGFIVAALKSIKDNTLFFGLSKEETVHILENIKNMKDIAESYAYRAEIIKRQTGHSPSNIEKLFSQFDAQLLSVGIFSMSTNPEHALMWAHYSGQHSGICLGFKKTPESRLSNPQHFLPVIYSDKLPEMAKKGFNIEMSYSADERGIFYVSSCKVAFSDETFQKAITTKPTCWSYEEEWRYVEPYSGLFDFPGTLAEITFGLKCKEDRKNHYIKLTEEHIPYPVLFYQIQKKRGSNELERVPMEKTVSIPKVTSSFMKNANDHETEKMTLENFAKKMERLTREEKYGEVLFQVDENLKKNPNNPALLNMKGVAHGYAQEHEEALECFTKLTEEYPEDANNWYQIACALTELKRYEEAIEALKKSYKFNPNDSSTAFNLGQLLSFQGNINEALMYYKRADSLGHRRAYSFISEIESENNK